MKTPILTACVVLSFPCLVSADEASEPNPKNRRGVSAHGEVLEELDKLTQVIESIRQASSNPVSPPTADGDELPARR